jgi:hypothetical protein
MRHRDDIRAARAAPSLPYPAAVRQTFTGADARKSLEVERIRRENPHDRRADHDEQRARIHRTFTG